MTIKNKVGSSAIRWLPASEIALTLVSVGEVSPSTMTKLQVVVQQVVTRHKPMQLQVVGAGGSPNMIMPKSAWVGIEGDKQALVNLQKDLAICSRSLITAIDDKPYEPVIEIGMLKKLEEKARTEMGRAIKMAGVGSLGEFNMASIHLLISKTTAIGQSLASVFEFPLSN